MRAILTCLILALALTQCTLPYNGALNGGLGCITDSECEGIE